MDILFYLLDLTQDEHAAVQRLQALGFSRQAAAEAYLACEKVILSFLFVGRGVFLFLLD